GQRGYGCEAEAAGGAPQPGERREGLRDQQAGGPDGVDHQALGVPEIAEGDEAEQAGEEEEGEQARGGRLGIAPAPGSDPGQNDAGGEQQAGWRAEHGDQAPGIETRPQEM